MQRNRMWLVKLVVSVCLFGVAASESNLTLYTHARSNLRKLKTKRPPRRKSKPARPDSAPTRAAANLPAGLWGGQHISLDVTNVGAQLTFDCAQGNIEKALMLDPHNSFDVTGVFVQERGGPIRVDEKPDSHPARYTGRLEGERLTLTITRADNQQRIGTFTLVRGQRPDIFRCL